MSSMWAAYLCFIYPLRGRVLAVMSTGFKRPRIGGSGTPRGTAASPILAADTLLASQMRLLDAGLLLYLYLAG